MNVPITQIKPNPKNPRVIKDANFEKLKRSIQEFPEMLEKRPLVCYTDTDGKLVVLGGNMRLKAAKELKIAELPVILADDWTAEQKAEFLVKDNVGFGEWNWEELQSEWDADRLEQWGLDVPEFAAEVDYSILDDEDVEQQLNDMTNGVKKAIQIEFEAEHYEEAYELVKFWRERGGYVGRMIMEFLKAEKEKL
jgi:ParB-like chromosome segregation protein Spo0J